MDLPTGFCKTPVTIHTGGIDIHKDPGWLIAMDGLSKTASLMGESSRHKGNDKATRTAEQPPQPAGQNSQPSNTADQLVERLFVGPDDARLPPTEHALLRAWLRTTPISANEQYHARKTNTPHPLEERRRKVQRILIYNREMDAAANDLLSPMVKPLFPETEQDSAIQQLSHDIDTTPNAGQQPIEDPSQSPSAPKPRRLLTKEEILATPNETDPEKIAEGRRKDAELYEEFMRANRAIELPPSGVDWEELARNRTDDSREQLKEIITEALQTALEKTPVAPNKADPIAAPAEQPTKGNRGRRLESDPKEDERIYNAWKTGSYRKYEDLARELGLPKRTVELAIDRHEKRVPPKE